MRILFLDRAREDADEIAEYLTQHYPHVLVQLERELTLTIKRVHMWPRSGALVQGEKDVRVTPLVKYPYKIFYRIKKDAIEILRIYHSRRK